ncbi:class I SAM-dependent methyltransferase [Kribbella albertanoniae]|uniref:Class I SAM-dependent methyltransferase n=1 Tax=Kribbella albertanoniae TaxID=1266829 RepID=A0A4R4PXU2_9ACTN|nr:class I SAM-dependent methyltransferase [Kribbella albertanoniae]TDC27386.1 class I SAM-dependent methyltransferase [Kribbella albertanoniae]
MSREQLRQTFSEDAELYDRVRPDYPPRLYDDLGELLGVAAPRVLEIGLGTGQATRPMVQRGWSVSAVELGAELAEVARRNLPTVDVTVADFDTWELPGPTYDLVLSATAFHWLDPGTRVRRCAQVLRPGGVLAIVSTHHVAGGSEQFFVDVQRCYERFTDDPAKGELPAASAVSEDSAEIDATGLFGPVTFHRYEWEVVYSAAEYIELLSSYSGHRALTADRRDGLYDCVRALINGGGGTVTKRYLTQLSAAVSLNQPLA